MTTAIGKCCWFPLPPSRSFCCISCFTFCLVLNAFLGCTRKRAMGAISFTFRTGQWCRVSCAERTGVLINDNEQYGKGCAGDRAVATYQDPDIKLAQKPETNFTRLGQYFRHTSNTR